MKIDLLDNALNRLREDMHADRCTPVRHEYLVASLLRHAPTLCAMQDVIAQAPPGDLVGAEVVPRFGRPELLVHARRGSTLAWRAVLQAMEFDDRGIGKHGHEYAGPFNLALRYVAAEDLEAVAA